MRKGLDETSNQKAELLMRAADMRWAVEPMI